MRFSANLGMLWTDRPLPEAIEAAARAGFDAVECHWPYAHDAASIAQALSRTGMTMISLNTSPGATDAGEFGLSALPGREADARAAIRQATDYAARIGARCVHVMAGRPPKPGVADGAAARSFADALDYACRLAAPLGLTVLIEPLNPHDVPGYFLRDTRQARTLIESLEHPNLKLMFDCYHVQRTEGDACGRLRDLRDLIGHVQIASVPDRGAPDHGDLDYGLLFDTLVRVGWDQPLGAEYKGGAATDATLGWLRAARVDSTERRAAARHNS